MTDVRFIAANFTTQEQAESVVRKLASLRGDRFRIERELPADAAGPISGASVEFASEVGVGGSAPNDVSESSFTLSLQVPATCVDQACSVIRAAGGQLR